MPEGGKKSASGKPRAHCRDPNLLVLSLPTGSALAHEDVDGKPVATGHVPKNAAVLFLRRRRHRRRHRQRNGSLQRLRTGEQQIHRADRERDDRAGAVEAKGRGSEAIDDIGAAVNKADD